MRMEAAEVRRRRRKVNLWYEMEFAIEMNQIIRMMQSRIGWRFFVVMDAAFFSFSEVR